MKSNQKKFNYENAQYLKMFETINQNFYQKYIAFIKKYLSNKKNKFLDVGCGNGNVLFVLSNKGYKNIFGCEISTLFVKASQKKGLKQIYKFNGKTLPFNNNHFDVIGSFGVLEHVKNPLSFLSEQVKKTKKNGFIIVVCPNFLSVFFKLSHPRTDKLSKRLTNIPRIFKKLTSKKISFEQIKPTIKKNFHADDDMVTITNLIDIEKFFRQNNCKIVYSNGFMAKDNFFYKTIGSIYFIKYLLPSCFLVAQKQ